MLQSKVLRLLRLSWKVIVEWMVMLSLAMPAGAQNNFRTNAGIPYVPTFSTVPISPSGGTIFVYSTDDKMYWYAGGLWLTASCVVLAATVTSLGASFSNPSAWTPEIPYTGTLTVHYTGGGVGGSYPAGKPIASTGVEGLTARLRAGTISSASGDLIFDVTGTPSSDGYASFDIRFWRATVTAQLLVNRLKAPDGTAVYLVQNPYTGRKWMDRNLGTAQAATSNITDPANFGSLYQWCRSSDGHQYRDSYNQNYGIYSTDKTYSGFVVYQQWNLDNLLTDGYLWWDPYGTGVGANNPCPEGYHVPTASEWGSELDTGIAGSILKLSLGGHRPGGDISDAGGAGYYWTSTWANAPAGYSFGATQVSFSNWGNMSMSGSTGEYQGTGNSIRCVKD